jgi:ribosomal protein L31E
MAKQKTEAKMILEREYNVPLRKEWLKAPEYRRGKKAVKALKEFIAKHMKIYDRDLRKVKVDILLNNEIRFRGIRHPPAKILVKAKKFDDGIVKVELVNIPEHIKYQLAREEKRKSEMTKKEVKETKEKPEVKKEISEETKEKEETSKEAEMDFEKDEAKKAKHTVKEKDVVKRESRRPKQG